MKLQIMSDLHFEMHADGGAGLIRELDPSGVPRWPIQPFTMLRSRRSRCSDHVALGNREAIHRGDVPRRCDDEPLRSRQWKERPEELSPRAKCLSGLPVSLQLDCLSRLVRRCPERCRRGLASGGIHRITDRWADECSQVVSLSISGITPLSTSPT